MQQETRSSLNYTHSLKREKVRSTLHCIHSWWSQTKQSTLCQAFKGS